MSDGICLEASDIGKSYGDGDRTLEILKDVSISVKRGQGVAILGPSGSGKTTLLNILSGLDKPTRGTVRVNGVDLNAMTDLEKARYRSRSIGYVFQFYHLLPEFTAIENVVLPALIRRDRNSVPRSQARERAASLLGQVGLKQRSEHFPSELSGGEQQRVAIARALMNDPAILFCDEPTGNLDPETGLTVAELLMNLFKKEKKTVFVVTHDERIAKMADSVWDMATGTFRAGI